MYTVTSVDRRIWSAVRAWVVHESQRIREWAQHTQSMEMFETDSDPVDITRTCLPRPGRFRALLRASVQGQGGRVIGMMIKALEGDRVKLSVPPAIREVSCLPRLKKRGSTKAPGSRLRPGHPIASASLLSHLPSLSLVRPTPGAASVLTIIITAVPLKDCRGPTTFSPLRSAPYRNIPIQNTSNVNPDRSDQG